MGAHKYYLTYDTPPLPLSLNLYLKVKILIIEIFSTHHFLAELVSGSRKVVKILPSCPPPSWVGKPVLKKFAGANDGSVSCTLLLACWCQIRALLLAPLLQCGVMIEWTIKINITPFVLIVIKERPKNRQIDR